MDMKTLDKTVVILLLIADAIAMIVGMISGPMGHQVVSVAASYCAVIISICLLLYLILSWKK